MNIKEAKNEIKQSLEAYFTKNEYGEYIISTEKQRPIFLLGAPGTFAVVAAEILL